MNSLSIEGAGGRAKPGSPSTGSLRLAVGALANPIAEQLKIAGTERRAIERHLSAITHTSPRELVQQIAALGVARLDHGNSIAALRRRSTDLRGDAARCE